MDISQKKNTFLLAISCVLLGMILMSLIFLIFHTPSREVISTPTAPKPIGPYSQAISEGDLVFTSGQIGINPETGNISENLEEQAEQVMKNLQKILESSGDDFSDVVDTRIYLVNLSDFSKVNEIYARYMGTSAPARSTIQVVALPKGAQVEIEMMAYHSP